jgi:hypothetical protein
MSIAAQALPKQNPISVSQEFVTALSGVSAVPTSVLFNNGEKKRILLACLFSFTTPFLIGAAVITHNRPTTQLQAPLAALAGKPLEAAQNNPVSQDELAMADYFIEKARGLANDTSADAQNQLAAYLSQAQAQVDHSTAAPEYKGQIAQGIAALSTKEPQRIAAPAPTPTNQSGVSTKSKTNSKQGSAILAAGNNSVWVDYPLLKENTQLYLTPEGNTNNATIYVSSKEAGRGFTIAATSKLTEDVTVTWYEINE